jgi:hypothetical protein
MPAPYTAFFYGTLMHPKILKRVIRSDGAHLEICPAVLLVSTVYLKLIGLLVDPWARHRITPGTE